MPALPVDTLILHGNNLDGNRGCQALRWSTQTILDRYMPVLRRLHANIFYNDHPHFHTREVDRKSAGHLWEVRHRGVPGFYVWGAKVVWRGVVYRVRGPQDVTMEIYSPYPRQTAGRRSSL